MKPVSFYKFNLPLFLKNSLPLTLHREHSEAALSFLNRGVTVRVMACPTTFILKSNPAAPVETYVVWEMIKLWMETMLSLGIRFRDKGWGKQCLVLLSPQACENITFVPPDSSRTRCHLGGAEVSSPHTKAPGTLILEFLSLCEASISLLVNNPICDWIKTKGSPHHLVILLFMITTGETWTTYCSVSVGEISLTINAHFGLHDELNMKGSASVYPKCIASCWLAQKSPELP